jgi:hypothetical protein
MYWRSQQAAQYPPRMFPNDEHPRAIFLVARYPIIMLILIGLAYMFFTPVPHRSEQNRVTHYACSMNPTQDFCRELREDRAHGRKEKALQESKQCTTDRSCRQMHGGNENAPYQVARKSK